MKLILCVLAISVAVGSCDGRLCACPPLYDPPSVIAWGQVTLDNGAPAREASIRAAVTAATSTCVQGSMEFAGTADSQGRYRARIRRDQPPGDSTCVFLRIAYPGDSIPTQTATIGPFRLRFSGGAPIDSVHADVQLVPVATQSTTTPR